MFGSQEKNLKLKKRNKKRQRDEETEIENNLNFFHYICTIGM